MADFDDATPTPLESPDVAADADATPLRPILVVDDTEANRYAVRHWLEQAGYRVLEAASGEAGLRLARDERDRPGLILLDVQLPDTSGFEVLRALRTERATARIPVIQLSASFTTGEWRAHGLETGADAYLTHPIEPRELLATVRALFRVREAESERERLLDAERVAREEANRARRAAQRAQAEAERAASAKSDFLATMSHEFRTPLNAFQGYLQLLEMGIAGPVTSQQREYLVRLQASSDHLLGLVNDVLDLSKLDAGRVTVARDTARAGEVVRAALALVAPQAAARGVFLEHALVPSGRASDGVRYVGDEYRVRQVLVNLLSNAVKFTAPGGRVTVRVGVARAPGADARLRGDGPWTFIAVADTGIGIAPEQRAAIFEPFVQAKGGRTREAGGTGLGLSISRRLAQLMGGDLTVESEVARGSVFTLWLPGAGSAVDVPADDAPAAAPEPPPAPSASPANPPTPGYSRVAHVVRDQAQIIVERWLDRLRHDPVTAPVAGLDTGMLENHIAILLVTLASSLSAIDAGSGAGSATRSTLLHDGGEIQRVIAELHGRQRYRLAWPAEAIAREYAILREEIVALVRRAGVPRTEERDAQESPADAAAIALLERLLERATQSSLRIFRHAGGEPGGG